MLNILKTHSSHADYSTNATKIVVTQNNSKLILLLCTAVLLMSSCAPAVYYQVYKVQPVNNLSESNNLIYEDANCKVVYDFWGKGGNAGFLLYNKSDKNIYINMEESFFVRNGIAYDYYQDRTSLNSTSRSSEYSYSTTDTYAIISAIALTSALYNYQGYGQANSRFMETTYSSGASKSTAYSTTSSSGVNFREKNIICIPPKSAKIISEYSINESLYRDCNLFLYPTKKEIRTSSFSEENSPLVFSNRISYTIEGTDDIMKMEHKFYVSDISNYSHIDIIEEIVNKNCEDERSSYQKSFKGSSPYRFYIRYT